MGAVVPALVQGGRPAVDARVPAGVYLHLRLPGAGILGRAPAGRYPWAMRWRRLAISAFRAVGGLRIVGRWFGRDRLAVLAYHRVVDHAASGFVGFVQNASASPESFAEQMRLVAAKYNPISISDVTDAVDGRLLPDRALLVTFDDGYRDNYDVALPTLTEYSIPAVVFLATNHIGSDDPFWWASRRSARRMTLGIAPPSHRTRPRGAVGRRITRSWRSSVPHCRL